MKKLYRSVKNKKIAGICGGIGEYYKVDPTIIRLLLVLFAIITAVIPFLIIYTAAIFIIPLEPQGIEVPEMKKLYRSDKKMLAGICAGISDYFAVDVTFVRLIFVIITILTAVVPMVLLYLIAWVIVPKK